MKTRLLIPLILCIALSLTASSCVLRKLRKDLDKIDRLVHWQGTVEAKGKPSQPTLFVLLSDQAKVVNYQSLHGDEEVSLYSPSGSYYLVAFQDLNRDFIYQRGEPCGYVGNPTSVTVADGATPERFHVVINQKELPFSIDLSPRSQNPDLVANKASLGQVVRLNDGRFNAETGALGLWQPLEFIMQGNAGLFFLASYDPKKIPILFVHGAGGYLSEWNYLIDRLDTKRYQPWVVSYPSGLSLDLVANYIEGQIRVLQIKYQFKQIVVTAHSMGGLVSRKMILLAHEDQPHLAIPIFISISTPWNGVASSEIGAKYAPTSVPSWTDLVPDNPFIKSLYQRSLGPKTRFYLLFGVNRSSMPSTTNHDGAIALSSALDERSQKDAQLVRGFNFNHEDILTSPEVSRQINEILSQ